jgi:hypothetical protein
MKISFDNLEREPERIRELSPAEATRMLGQLASLYGTLLVRALSSGHNDHLISFDEAAPLLRGSWVRGTRGCSAMP